LQGSSSWLVSDHDLVHSRPNPATNGVVTVDFQWTPPANAGGSNFLVYAVAANDDGRKEGDRTALAQFNFTWGCEPFTLRRDIDGDGYGVDSETRPDCNEREGWASEAGDCNDVWSTIHPGASEIGNSKDADCDGGVDEGIDSSIVCPDQDGDGYGDFLSESVPGAAWGRLRPQRRRLQRRGRGRPSQRPGWFVTGSTTIVTTSATRARSRSAT